MTPDSETTVTRLIELSRENREVFAELEKLRRFITVMFTDIRGSTAYFDRFGDVAGLVMVHQCNKVLLEIVERRNGRLHKTIGDSIMVSFESCRESVQAAIEMQQQLAKMNADKPEEQRTLVRIGLHYGTGIAKSNDVFGDVVNVASRVESFARPEQIVISDSLEQQVRDCNFELVLLGRFQLKGKGDCNLFEVVWGPESKPQAVAAHTIVSTTLVSGQLKLQHVMANGNVDAEYVLKDRLTIGRTQGDFVFPADCAMAPLHGRVSVENGQVFVENLSQEGSVFVRLVSVYTLEDRDVIMMGRQGFEFREATEAMAVGAAMGASLANLTAMLKAPVAEFVRLNSDEPAGPAYPLNEQEVTFGRSQGTYRFPEDRLLSHTHARVYQRGENFFLEDAGSRNGTFVKVRGKAPVPVGATILIGRQLLRLSD